MFISWLLLAGLLGLLSGDLDLTRWTIDGTLYDGGDESFLISSDWFLTTVCRAVTRAVKVTNSFLVSCCSWIKISWCRRWWCFSWCWFYRWNQGVCTLNQRNRTKSWNTGLLFLNLLVEGILSWKFSEVCSFHQLDRRFINLSICFFSCPSSSGDHLASLDLMWTCFIKSFHSWHLNKQRLQ